MKNLQQKIQYEYKRYMDSTMNPDYIMNKAGRKYENLRNTKSDAHLWSSIQQRKSGVLCLEYRIKGNKEKEITKWLEKLKVKQIIRDILEAPLFGFQPIEVVWSLENNKLIPSKLLAQKQEYFTFDTDGNLKYYDKTNTPKDIPKYKILCPTYEATNINPYGQPLLAKSYWHVQFKTDTIRNWVSFSDKFGIPIYKASYDRIITDVEKTQLRTEISLQSEENLLLIPKEIELEIEALKTTTSKEIFNGIIQVCNTEISKAILAQTLTTEVNIGSYAAATIHYKVRKEVIQSDIEIVENTINELINWYYELNYNGENDNKFDIIYSNEDNNEIISRDEKLIKLGVKFTKEYINKQYNLNNNDYELQNTNPDPQKKEQDRKRINDSTIGKQI